MQPLPDTARCEGVRQQQHQISELGEPIVSFGVDVASAPTAHRTVRDLGDRRYVGQQSIGVLAGRTR